MTRIQERAGLPTASNYQVKIFEAVESAVSEIIAGERPNSLIIDAKPGSGKTTTGVAATRLIPDGIPTIFVAFNKKIANELALRLPPGIPARTFHAHWLRQWGRYIRLRHNKSTEVNDFKVHNAVEKHMGLNRFRKNRRALISQAQIAEQKKKRQQADDVVFLVEKAKIFGVVPRGYPNGQSVTGYEDNDFFWLHIMEYFNYQINPEKLEETLDIVREILWEGLENETEIDFADMLYLPAVKNTHSELFHIVMIDEAQDLNGLQRYLLTRMTAEGGMIIAIGDKRQSCYAFRGADAESMDHIKDEFACDEYPLSISYRCAQAIVAEAYEIYPEIESAPNAPMGSVERPENWKLADFRPGHLIICRNNAPTISLAYQLIRHRIPAKVLGRDIGEGLMKLVRQCDEDNTLAEMIDNLRAWRDHQLVLVERKNPDDERGKDQIRDKYTCITELATGDEILNVEQLLSLIDQMFTTAAEERQAISSSRVTLSTIHKIKGAEADTVFILDPHLINPPWIRSDWQYIQEKNLHFVGITRAKTRLIYINSDAIKS